MPEDVSEVDLDILTLEAIERSTYTIQQLSNNVALCTTAIKNLDNTIRESMATNLGANR